jgi:hypothetical protein
MPVLRREQSGISVFFSHGGSSAPWSSASVGESARQFHQVVRRVFDGGAVIPFRFPTLMENEEELAAHLRENADDYASELRRFGNSAQMDLLIRWSQEGQPTSRRKLSGTEYLRARQQRDQEVEKIAAQLRSCVGGAVEEWRSRSLQNGTRLAALVERNTLGAFKERLRGFSVPAGFEVRVRGPWPVTEFLELNLGWHEQS